jgi:hypothetical protein
VLVALGGGRGSAGAHTVTLADGSVLEGRVLEQGEAEVVIETTFDGEKRVARAQVKAVDLRTPPLREQLSFRLDQAGVDPALLWEAHAWAKGQGFKQELQEIVERILRQKPDDARARKLLGHEKVDGRWMSPADKAQHELDKQAAAQRAKGLVEHEGRWVTPQEKAAREKGLLQDGDDWVTEEDYHRRRGEQKVDGRWVRVGEAEGKAWGLLASQGARVPLAPLWTPHFDLLHEVPAPLATQTAEGLEKSYVALRRVLAPQGDDLPETLAERLRVVLVPRRLPTRASPSGSGRATRSRPSSRAGPRRCSVSPPSGGWIPSPRWASTSSPTSTRPWSATRCTTPPWCCSRATR